MMARLVGHTLAGLALFGAVGCANMGPEMNAKAAAMEQALLTCKVQLGYAGQTKTEVKFSGGLVMARVLPFDQITAADAAKINACADGADVLEDGLVVVPMQAETAPAPVAAPVRVAAPVPYAGSCPAGHNGMFGGTSYCVGGAN